MRITRETKLFEYTDKVVKTYLKQILKAFRRMQRRTITAFDEANVMLAVNSEWRGIMALIVEALKKIAAYYYRAALRTCGIKRRIDDFVVDAWLMGLLDDLDYVTHYQFNNEADRKRARLIEAVLSVFTGVEKKKQIDIAMRYLVRQFEQTADNVTSAAVIHGYEDAGIEKVEWVTQRDEKVCEECLPLDGKVFPIDDCPPCPEHYNCRCFLLPVL
ncbi:MAG: minor capsid protein [Prevotella sp.]|nr:minor capsid protein [Prevotella sp.]